MEEETHYQAIEPTKPVMNPYEFIPIPPPPPHARKRKTWPLLLLLALLIIGASSAFIAIDAYQKDVQTQKVHQDATSTANTANFFATGTANSEGTSIAVTHIALNATSTQVSSNVTATAIQFAVNATVIASIPTPTPAPSVNTVNDLYGQFINAGIAMGNAGDIPDEQWIQDGFASFPGRGGISFIDEVSYGTMWIALFNTVHGASVDASEAGSWGTYRAGKCLLFYQSAATNLTPYQQVMQQYCS